jgi:cobalt-zinc-cadmium efflux system protein
MLDQMQGRLARDFSLQHSTIQFETAAHADHERPEHD